MAEQATRHNPDQCWNIWNGSLRTKFGETWINTQQFSFKKIQLKLSSAKWRPFCLGRNVLMHDTRRCIHVAIKRTSLVQAMTTFFALSYYRTYHWISGHLEQYVMEIHNHLFDKIDETCRHQIIYNFIRAWYTRMYNIFMMQLVLNGTADNDWDLSMSIKWLPKPRVPFTIRDYLNHHRD